MSIERMIVKSFQVLERSFTITKVPRLVFLIFGMFDVLLVFGGCATESEPPPASQFIVKIDSMQHTPFGALTDTISIKLYGMIGSDGCSSFLKIDETRKPSGIDLTV